MQTGRSAAVSDTAHIRDWDASDRSVSGQRAYADRALGQRIYAVASLRYGIMDRTALYLYKTTVDRCDLCYIMRAGCIRSLVVSGLEYVSAVELYAYSCIHIAWSACDLWVCTDLFRGSASAVAGIVYSGVVRSGRLFWDSLDQ